MLDAASRKKGTRVAFGDVVRLCRERSSDPEQDGFERYVSLEHIDPGDLKIRRWGNVARGTTFTNVFRAGQVLFGKRRAYQRKVAVADFDGVCSGDIYVLEANGDHLLPELLPFICQTDAFVRQAVGTSAGSLSPRTNWDSLSSYEFALPAKDEQRRIASACNAAFHAIDSLRRVGFEADHTRRSLFCSVYRFGTRGEDRHETPLGLLPRSWNVETLEDRYEVQLGNPETPIIVERVVNDIDEIVRIVRFDGWQSTHAGEREVKLALRKTLFKYRLHQDQDLFDKLCKRESERCDA